MQLSSRAQLMALYIGGPIVLVASLLIGSVLLREKTYEHGTPEQMLEAAKQMVLDGRADRVPELVWTDWPDMRRLLDEAGRLMGAMQRLADTVQRRYPDEIAEMRTRAEAAARDGKAATFFSGMLEQNRGRRREQFSAGRDEIYQMFNDTMHTLLSDPYAWLTSNEEKLRAVAYTDEDASLMWDGKPVPGVAIRTHDDKWYFDLPMEILNSSGAMPRTPDEWQMYGYLIVNVRQMAEDLEAEVARGEHPDMRSVVNAAGEDAFLPLALTMVAIEKARDERRDEERAREREQQPAQNPGDGG